MDSNPYWNTYSNPQAEYLFNRNWESSQCLRASVCWFFFFLVDRSLLDILFMGTYLLRDFGLLSQTPWKKWLLKIPNFPWFPWAWSLPALWQGQGRSLSSGVFWVLVWANTVKVSEVWSWKLLQDHWLPALYLGCSGHCGIKKIRLKRLWLTAEKQGRYTGLESKAGIIWQMFRKTAELRIIQFVFKKKALQ